MQDKKYLLSISELLTGGSSKEPEALVTWCLKWLDAERLGRVKRLLGAEDVTVENFAISSVQMSRKMAENIGAGLLLQLAVLQAEADMNDMEVLRDEEIIQLTISELLSILEQSAKKPLSLEYTYGENGKPYLKDYPYYFNLSHSGEYIFCVISKQEIGVDIQWAKPLKDDRIARRFFSEEEKQALAGCSTEQERQKLFYRLWACKEAYGKLTGQGIVAAIGADVWTQGKNTSPPKYVADAGEETCKPEILGEYQLKEYILEEYQIEDYQMAVSKWKQES